MPFATPNTRTRYNPAERKVPSIVQKGLRGLPDVGINKIVRNMLKRKSNNNKPSRRLFGEAKVTKKKPEVLSKAQLEFKLTQHAKSAEFFRLRADQHKSMSKKFLDGNNDQRLHRKLARTYTRMADKHDKEWQNTNEMIGKAKDIKEGIATELLPLAQVASGMVMGAGGRALGKLARQKAKKWLKKRKQQQTTKPIKESAQSKANDFLIAKAIKKTFKAGRKVQIDGEPVSKDDWDYDKANPERKAKPIVSIRKPDKKAVVNAMEPFVKRSEGKLKVWKSIKNKQLTYESSNQLDELAGKGSLDTIGRIHSRGSQDLSKTPAQRALHGLNRNRAARLHNVVSGKSPVGKPNRKINLQYAKDDSAKARAMRTEEKTVIGTYTPERADHHFKGDRYERHAHNLGHSSEWHSIIKTHQGGQHLQNQWGGYPPIHTGSPKYIGKKWEGLKKQYNNPNVRSFKPAPTTNEGMSPEFQKQMKDTSDYLNKRDNEIIDRHKKLGHPPAKIALDMKLHPAVVSAAIGSVREDLVNEISKGLAKRYIEKASFERDAKQNQQKFFKRSEGIQKAREKLWKSAAIKVNATEEKLISRREQLNTILEAKRGRPKKIVAATGTTDDPHEEPGNHIIAQLRKVETIKKPVLFKSGEYLHVPKHHATKALNMYGNLKKPAEKEDLIKKLHHSSDSFRRAIGDK